MSVEQVTDNAGELRWFKSSHSGSDGGDCVEVATGPEAVHVRDSKAADGPILRVGQDGWVAFLVLAAERG